jgi:RNA polymerase sigma-70 factor, ECF subfamily
VTDASVNTGESPGSTSLGLLERIKALDQVAWERMVSLYSPLVYRWCRQAGLQAADAADVGQEVFRSVARKIGDFRREREGDTFRGWLRTITRNKIRDSFRRKRTELAGAGGSEAQERLLQAQSAVWDESDNPCDEGERKILYRRAVELVHKEFAERTWQAFWRVAVDEHRPADVAAALGMSVNAVYLAKSRVLRRLREELAGLMEESFF